MGRITAIPWADATINFFTGCKPVSDACDWCYAKDVANWLKGLGIPKYKNGFDFTVHVYKIRNDWTRTLKSKKPLKIFINSMSDMFFEKASYDEIEQQFVIMNNYPQHTYLLLTKRTNKRSLNILNKLNKLNLITKNLWLGVTIEHQKYFHNRMQWLAQTPVKTKWISAEPLLGPLEITAWHKFIDWLVVGGESGRNARQMKVEWVFDLLDQAKDYNIPLFFKQWGNYQIKGKCKCHKAKGCMTINDNLYIDYPYH
jgi:protein gp37